MQPKFKLAWACTHPISGCKIGQLFKCTVEIMADRTLSSMHLVIIGWSVYYNQWNHFEVTHLQAIWLGNNDMNVGKKLL